MKRAQIDRFFHELSKKWKFNTRILLLGGAEALILGGTRPTLDVDFEVQFRARGASWEEFGGAVQEVSAKTGIGVQYAESVERWSQVTFLDYRRHTRPVKRFGTIEVRILQPVYWSIGKIARYWEQDIKDLVSVFHREKPDPLKLAEIWALALRRSPRSTQLALVRRQALHFFRTFGKRIWGSRYRPERIERLFHQGG